MTARSNAEDLFKQGFNAAWCEHRPRKAIKLLREAMIVDPQFTEPLLQLAKVFFHYTPARLYLASSAIRQYLAANPNSADGHHFQGLIEARLGNTDESDAAFRRAIELDPLDVRPLVSLGMALLDRHNAFDAVPLLEHAVQIYSNKKTYAEPATRLCLADAYERTGDIARAIEQWEIVAELPEVWDEDKGCRKSAHAKLKEHR